MEEKRTEIGELGEFGLIRHLADQVTIQNKTTVKGIGDDAAVIDIGEEYLVLSTDMLVEGIHFDLTYAPLQHVGYKAIVVNVSDIAAMNARPEQVTVSLGLSNRFSVEAVDALYDGIRQACADYKVDLVGGDTTTSRSGLILSISVVGRVKKENVVYRSGAKPNDIICATGDLGGAYLGLQILEREKQVFMADPNMQPDLEKYDYLVGRVLKPAARTDIVYELAEKGVVPTAMMDISDGLSSELLHISKASGTGVRIFEENLPIAKQTYEQAVELNLDPITLAMNGGDDYELLFTINQSDYEKIKNDPDIHFIGYVHEKANENVLVTKQGNVVPLQAQGWKHF